MNQEENNFGRIVPKKSNEGTHFKKSSISIPRIEEQVKVETKVIESGKVHVRKLVKEHQELVDIPLKKEEVKIERFAKNEYLSTPPPAVRQEGNTTIISVLEEVTIVEKKLLLVEEVHITKHQVYNQEIKEFTLLKEEVIVERTSSEPYHIEKDRLNHTE